MHLSFWASSLGFNIPVSSPTYPSLCGSSALFSTSFSVCSYFNSFYNTVRWCLRFLLHGWVLLTWQSWLWRWSDVSIAVIWHLSNVKSPLLDYFATPQTIGMQQIYQKSLFHDDLEGAGGFFSPLTFGDMRPQSHLLGLFCLGPLEACSGLPNYPSPLLPQSPSPLTICWPHVILSSFTTAAPFFSPSSLASTHLLQQLPNFFPSPLKIASQRQRERK